jgi:hypothetical protein
LKKEFYCVNTPGITRQQDILKKLNLENRIVDSIDDIDDTTLEYDKINPVMQNCIDKSKQYILEALR